jgi:hypothetical protein
MTALTGRSPSTTYKDLLQVSNSNAGIDATLRPVEDGEGTESPLELSTTNVNIASGFQVGGADVTAAGTSLLTAANAAAQRTALGLGTAATQATGAFDAAGTAAAAVTTHEGLSDPHPQYLTASEGSAAYQPLDAELTAIAGLTSAANKLPYFTGSGTAALADLTASGRAILDDADASAQRTTLGLAIGTDVQAQNARLQDIATNLSSTSGAIEKTAANTFGTYTVTAAGKALIDDADAAAQRTTLGLGTAATSSTTAFATAAQGTKADSALQPTNNLSDVSSAPTAINNILPTQTSNSGKLLTTNGTAASWGYPALPSAAFASLPSAASNSGVIYLVTDAGNAPFISNGSVWKPLGGVALIAASGASVSTPASSVLNETLVTVTIPANIMGPNGQLEIFTLWTVTTSANNKTVRVTFGGTDFAASVWTTQISSQLYTNVANKNATNSQKGMNAATSTFFGGTTSAHAPSSVDTTAAVSLTLKGQCANSADTITLEKYSVKLLVP